MERAAAFSEIEKDVKFILYCAICRIPIMKCTQYLGDNLILGILVRRTAFTHKALHLNKALHPTEHWVDLINLKDGTTVSPTPVLGFETAPIPRYI